MNGGAKSTEEAKMGTTSSLEDGSLEVSLLILLRSVMLRLGRRESVRYFHEMRSGSIELLKLWVLLSKSNFQVEND